MKNRFFFSVVSALSLVAVSASAATPSSRSVTRSTSVAHESSENANLIGFHAGLGIATGNLGFPPGQEAANPLGSLSKMTFGVSYQHNFTSNFALLTGLDYVPRGFSENAVAQGQAGLETIADNYSVNYLELPVMAKLQFRAGVATPYLAAGPFLGILMSKGETITDNGQTISEDPLNNRINGTNFGINIGAGSAFELSRGFNLEVGARYSFGLSNVLSNAQPAVQPGVQPQPQQQQATVKLNSFQILTGLAFTI